jgi:hypothetical protein
MRVRNEPRIEYNRRWGRQHFTLRFQSENFSSKFLCLLRKLGDDRNRSDELCGGIRPAIHGATEAKAEIEHIRGEIEDTT